MRLSFVLFSNWKIIKCKLTTKMKKKIERENKKNCLAALGLMEIIRATQETPTRPVMN
jgi:hypothetical protein